MNCFCQGPANTSLRNLVQGGQASCGGFLLQNLAAKSIKSDENTHLLTMYPTMLFHVLDVVDRMIEVIPMAKVLPKRDLAIRIHGKEQGQPRIIGMLCGA